MFKELISGGRLDRALEKVSQGPGPDQGVSASLQKVPDDGRSELDPDKGVTALKGKESRFQAEHFILFDRDPPFDLGRKAVEVMPSGGRDPPAKVSQLPFEDGP